MEFKINTVMWVEESDLEEMCNMVKHGMTPMDAFESVSCGWDDCWYFLADYIENDVLEEIERRMAK